MVFTSLISIGILDRFRLWKAASKSRYQYLHFPVSFVEKEWQTILLKVFVDKMKSKVTSLIYCFETETFLLACNIFCKTYAPLSVTLYCTMQTFLIFNGKWFQSMLILMRIYSHRFLSLLCNTCWDACH